MAYLSAMHTSKEQVSVLFLLFQILQAAIGTSHTHEKLTLCNEDQAMLELGLLYVVAASPLIVTTTSSTL
uniref:Putative secreted protein n=1 Tax=Panstrongylus lignarius TaxID=156445 RepID=A0A224Y4X8_9HEMI